MNENTQKLLDDPYVRVKYLDNNLMSLNFSREAFTENIWNEQTIKARGLFCDQTTGEIRLRAYDKFFNVGQREDTKPEYLKEHVAYPLVAYKKENGFLGIYCADEPLATKSVIDNKYVEYFKEAFETLPLDVRNYLYDISKKYNCSFTFEVLHTDDKHIINIDETHVVILDAIPNKYTNNGLDYEFSNMVLSGIDSKYTKKKVGVFNTWEDLENYVANNNNSTTSEGIVVHDANGLMFKYKFDYYNMVKKLRSYLRRVKKIDKTFKTEDERFNEIVLPIVDDFLTDHLIGEIDENVVDFVSHKDYKTLISDSI